MTALSVRGVSKSFGPVRALGDVSFDVDAGRVAALLGPSGCGKTTLLRIVAGFVQPDAGVVTIGGEQVTGPGVQVRPERRSIGYVAQESALFPHLSVARNIGFALDARERRAKVRVSELLELVSLDPGHLERFPHELSGGQQQRVALARALARRPRLMLLDEPFAALDTSLRAETRDLMAAALAAARVTTVLVTHDQEEALSFADRIVVLRDGLVRQVGSPRELYESPVDAWTAGFVGDAVLVPGSLGPDWADTPLGRVPLAPEETPDDSASRRDGQTRSATILIRPEQLQLSPWVERTDAELGADRIGADRPTGMVRDVSYRGHDTVASVTLTRRADITVQCRIPGDAGWVAPGVTVLIRLCGQGRVVSPAADSAAAASGAEPQAR